MSENTKRSRSKKSFPGQHDDEEVLKVERKFPVVLRIPLIIGMFLLIVALLPWAIAMNGGYTWVGYSTWWMGFAVLILIFYWLRTWVGWHYSVYVLTTNRLMIVNQHGFFSREVNELTLNNVQNVNYKQKGMQAALFGFGTVTVETLSGGEPLKLTLVQKPAKMQQAIVEAANNYK